MKSQNTSEQNSAQPAETHSNDELTTRKNLSNTTSTKQQSSKRSSSVNLSSMRKVFSAKPVAVGVSAVLLAACSDDREEAYFFANLDECKDQYPEYSAVCQSAYSEALQEAARTSPKYNYMSSCESEFGVNQCVPYQAANGSSWFMPFMAGYMISGLFSNRHYSSPLFTSYSYSSPYRYKWIGSDGYIYGEYKTRKKKVRKDAFKPKPTVTRTIKRGGFGSSVRAKSSWGSSRGGWGG